MVNEALEARISKIVFWVLLLVAVVVTPWWNLDPINLPKLLVLSAGVLFLVGNVGFAALRGLGRGQGFLYLSFVVIVFLSSLIGKRYFFGQFYGDFGRMTGALCYAVLLLLFVSLAASGSGVVAKRVVLALALAGVVNLVYALVQHLGWDPVDWSNPYNPILGTFGNPNFISAFLGIVASVGIVYLIDSGTRWVFRLVILGCVGLAIFLIDASVSVQGFGVITGGLVLALYMRFVHGKKLVYRASYQVVVVVGFLFLLLGTLQRGPLKGVAYQASVTYRGDYWRAGIEMLMKHPFLGVGMDSYGDYYRASRTEAAALRRGPDVVSNSAHNVFLDIASNGGFLLLFAYVGILGLVIYSAWSLLKKMNGYDPLVVALVVAWVGYIGQSAISINQNGLATWGWAMGGVIVGLKNSGYSGVVSAKKVDYREVPASRVIGGSVGLVVGLVLALPIFIKDVQFRSALQSLDAARIEKVATGFPATSYYLDYAAGTLARNKGLEDVGLRLAKEAAKLNPRDFSAWQLIYSNPKVSLVDRADAVLKMKALDPFNMTIKP